MRSPNLSDHAMRFPFMRLPTELSDMIYQCALREYSDGPSFNAIYRRSTVEKADQPGVGLYILTHPLLAVSRQVRFEALSLFFYRKNRAGFLRPDFCDANDAFQPRAAPFLRFIGSFGRQKLRRLCLTWDPPKGHMFDIALDELGQCEKLRRVSVRVNLPYSASSQVASELSAFKELLKTNRSGFKLEKMSRVHDILWFMLNREV
ncbi:hypothetical protein K402DRAFT_395168 [Aulographum hederae CBS 113979]|uniref:F-box domain-containing protein n=1 Tax=Aulographum hederae CBS 113979 TaxID=1176131 RepID=A0A6G1GVY3_9PEZI|nr:hypothetical protein K402DRAFT_395168 [Aulographum hederae CBS 113979]